MNLPAWAVVLTWGIADVEERNISALVVRRRLAWSDRSYLETKMRFTVFLALIGWMPFVVLLFATLPPRKALLIAMIGGWLFLPVYIVKLKTLPEFSKLTASSYGCLIGIFLFDFQRLLTFRFKWYDIPMLCWCVTPFITSCLNDQPYGISPALNAYEGGSAMIANMAEWGIPYFLGRIYFPDWESFKDLGIAIFIGGLIYVPLCLLEIRISPQLHRFVYGFYPGDFTQVKRFGGYRPMVFLSHGLSVGMWMTSASLVGIWMWQSKTIKHLWGVPMAVLVPVLFVTTVLCKSTAGLLFLMGGLAILYSIRWLRMPLLLLGVMAVAPTYMYLRASGTWTGDYAIETAREIFGPERAQSLQTRIKAENLLAAHALEQPWFGWGRFNRNRVYDVTGKDMAPTDGMWVIALGVSGLVGLFGLTMTIMLPPLLVWARCPLKMWTHPGLAPAVAMAVLLALYMLDNILNAMPDPIFILTMGGLVGIGPSIRRQLKNAKLGIPPAQAVAMPQYASAPPATMGMQQSITF